MRRHADWLMDGQPHGLGKQQSGSPHGIRRRTVLLFQSGDSSVVTRWTVDQEVVGSNPTHGGNLISGVRSLSGLLSSFGKMSTGFRWPGSST